MKGDQLQAPKVSPSDAERAEAAIWIARLHDEQRSATLDTRVQAWLAESASHRQAFEAMTRVWERTAVLRSHAPRRLPSSHIRLPSRKVWITTLAALVLFGSGIAALRLWRANIIVTEIGQQQVRVLPDGTRLMLNTDTRIDIAYDKRVRRVRLIHGEAWFDVSKRPAWPFVVNVNDREVRALGTSFVVRHDDAQSFSVTLLEGKISVSDTLPQVLTAGQRLQVSQRSPAVLDHPEIGRVTAWEHGRVEFEATPLGEAAKEMNRYSSTHVVVDAEIDALSLGGVFRAGDSDEFARVAAAALGLRVIHHDAEIFLQR